MNRWTFAKIAWARHTNARPQSYEWVATQSSFLFPSSESPGNMIWGRGSRTQGGNGGN